MDSALSFQDIIKKSLLKSDLFGVTDLYSIIIGILITFLIAMFIFYIYKKTYSGVIYNHTYNVSLVLMAIITSMIIMTISSNIVLSLGMVGALSIVRFRTAVKDPMDIVFMFWSIALGITTGARLYTIAAVTSLFIGVITLLLMRYKNTNNRFLLIIHYESVAKDNLFSNLGKLDYKIKSKTINRGITELTLEFKIIGEDTSFLEDISEINGVIDSSLISYNGSFAE